MAHMDVSGRRRATRPAFGFTLAAVLIVGTWPAPAPAATGLPGAAEHHSSAQVMADTPVDDGGMADTGSAHNQLLILGAAMMLAGGIAAYAVSRRHGAGHH